jgi:MFS family permease
LQSTGAIDNVFLISLIFTLINVGSAPISFYAVERFGRRTILIYGAFGMMVCQFLVGIIGVTVGFNHTHPLPDGTSVANNILAVNAQIAFITSSSPSSPPPGVLEPGSSLARSSLPPSVLVVLHCRLLRTGSGIPYSAKWKPTVTFAETMGTGEKGLVAHEKGV